LMSHFQLRETSHQKLRKQHGVTSGTTPQGDLTIDDVAIMSAGACGAFIHGLEDEMSGVRVAAIDAVVQHCSGHPELSTLALDFLVDMFNDEGDRVRLKAIESLTELCRHFVLAEVQLDVMLSILEDGNASIRHAALALLSHARIANHICLHVVVSAVLACLQKYPLDRDAVWACAAALGQHHAHFAEFLITRTLALNPHFASMEPSPSDTGYITIMIFLCAARGQNSAIARLVPAYFEDHHLYLAVEYPQYVCHPDDVGRVAEQSPKVQGELDWAVLARCWQQACTALAGHDRRVAAKHLHACQTVLGNQPSTACTGLRAIVAWGTAWIADPKSQVRRKLTAVPMQLTRAPF